MKPTFLTSQTTVVFGSINDLGMPIGVDREESHLDRLSDVPCSKSLRARGQRTGELDTPQRRAWTTENHVEVTEEILRLKTHITRSVG
ncbi:MAG: hypothetical protein O7F12_02755 [Nitrospirae bacterium]|nr:hypothetical protein [Nitrospirota bacterium]